MALYAEAYCGVGVCACIAIEDGVVKKAIGNDCYRLFDELVGKYGEPSLSTTSGSEYGVRIVEWGPKAY